jgi:hypothetical protein
MERAYRGALAPCPASETQPTLTASLPDKPGTRTPLRRGRKEWPGRRSDDQIRGSLPVSTRIPIGIKGTFPRIGDVVFFYPVSGLLARQSCRALTSDTPIRAIAIRGEFQDGRGEQLDRDEASCGYGHYHDLLSPIAARLMVAHPGRSRLISAPRTSVIR